VDEVWGRLRCPGFFVIQRQVVGETRVSRKNTAYFERYLSGIFDNEEKRE
jgi:hypothetical protein